MFVMEFASREIPYFSALVPIVQGTLGRKFEAGGCVSCIITVKLRPLTLQQNINENLTYQTVRKHLIKVALSLNLYLPSFFRAKLVNSKNDPKNAPECKGGILCMFFTLIFFLLIL